MRQIFFVIAFLMLATIGFCCFFLRRRDSDLKNELFFVNLAAFLTLIFEIFSLLNLNQKFSLFLNGLYFAGFDWLLLFLTSYLFVFTKTPIRAKSVVLFRKIVVAVATLDAISMILNIFTGFAFEITPFLLDGKFYCWNFKYHIAFFVHLGFCYVLSVLIFYGLLKKTIITNKFYRLKYAALFIIFALVVLLNVYWIQSDRKIDISVLFYGFFASLATYFSFFAEPKNVEARMLRLVTENINNGVLCFDLNKKCIYENKIARQFFPNEEAACDELEDFVSTGKEFLLRDLELFRDGLRIVLSEEFYVMRDLNHSLLGFFIFFEDVTGDLNLINQERFRSSHDSLTGLYNRSNFFLRAERILRVDLDAEWYFVCTDIVNFKFVNDLFGSKLGDKILRKEAEILQEITDAETVVGRISNDRFALVIKKGKFKPEIFERKFSELSSFLSGYNYKIHFKVGVYEVSDLYESVNTMYDKAELAIRKNEDVEKILSFYSTSMMQNLVEEKNVVTSFEKALSENQFAMYLQPQISCKNGKCAGTEALVRWVHPEKGVLCPSSFVPILENAGLLYKLDLFIWEEAAKKLAEWKSRGIDMHIAVNISAKDFYHLDLYKIFTELVQKYQIDAEKLKLEITETVFMHDIKLHTSILSKLQSAGFSIEMDDFGSGYSSLNMLKNLTVDILKIDMFFLRNSQNSERSKLILTKIIKMAKKLGLTVISEGVETEENAEFLRNAGCDFFQGYLYSKPVPVLTFEKKFISSESDSDKNSAGNTDETGGEK